MVGPQAAVEESRADVHVRGFVYPGTNSPIDPRRDAFGPAPGGRTSAGHCHRIDTPARTVVHGGLEVSEILKQFSLTEHGKELGSCR